MGKSLFLVRVAQQPFDISPGSLCHTRPVSLYASLPWHLDCFQRQRPLVSSGSDCSVGEAFAPGRVGLGGWVGLGGRISSLGSAPSKGLVLKRVWELWDPGMGSLQGEGGEAGVEQGGELTCAAPGILYPSEKYAYLFLAEQMDELLQRCFLHALKCQVKKADLPLLTSTFLGSHMFSCWYGRQGVGHGLSLVPWWCVRTGV